MWYGWLPFLGGQPFFRALWGSESSQFAAETGGFRDSLARYDFFCKTGAVSATISSRRAWSIGLQQNMNGAGLIRPPDPSESIDWEQSLSENAGWLRAVIANRLHRGDGQHAVDEVMQEVALAAVKAPAGGVNPDKVGPWLYQVAVRQTLMYRRKTGRQRRLVDRYAERHANRLHAASRGTVASSGDPLVWLLAVERAEQIRTVIGNLHRRDREILMLKYEQGWSYHQLAEHLGISHSAVEARLHRARKRLRQELIRNQLVEEDR